MDTFTLNGREWHFRVPALPIQIDLVMAWQHNNLRVAAAALGLCLQDADGKGLVKGSYIACGCNPLVYGGLVQTELHNDGVPLTEWHGPAIEVFSRVAAAYSPLKSSEVGAAEDFTEAAKADGNGLVPPSP